MYKKTILATIVMASLSSPSFAFLDKLEAVTDTVVSTQASGGDISQSVAELEQQYQAASIAVLESQVEIAKALNISKEIEEAGRLSETLKQGNLSSDTVEKVSATSSILNEEIEKSLSSTEQLTEEQQKHVSAGLLNYAVGVGMTAVLVVNAKDLGEQASNILASANAFEKVKLAVELAGVTTLAAQLPGHVANLLEGGTQFFSLASNKGVDTSEAAKKLEESAGFEL